jgi:hypothetical protein
MRNGRQAGRRRGLFECLSADESGIGTRDAGPAVCAAWSPVGVLSSRTMDRITDRLFERTSHSTSFFSTDVTGQRLESTQGSRRG